MDLIRQYGVYYDWCALSVPETILIKQPDHLSMAFLPLQTCSDFPAMETRGQSWQTATISLRQIVYIRTFDMSHSRLVSDQLPSACLHWNVALETAIY